jgi:hypothetical protein
VLRNYLHYPIIFSREVPPTGCCLSAVRTFVSTPPLTCEPNLRTILDPSGLLRDQSLATTTKTHRQVAVFPNMYTHHDPRNSRHPALARCGGEGLLHCLSPITTRYRLFGRPERIPMQITLVDISKRPLLTHERAPITPWGCQHRWPCDYHLATSHSYGFLLAHLTGLVNCGKAVLALLLLALPGTVDVSIAQPPIPARPSATAAEGLGTWAPRIFLSSRIEEAPHTPRVGAGAAPPLKPHPDQPAAYTAFQTHWARLVSNMGHRPPHLGVVGAHFHHF